MFGPPTPYWSSVLFARESGGQKSPGLTNWLLFYEQIGSPPLQTAACLAATVSLGAYPIADLVRFWQWQQDGANNPRIKAIRVALLRWLTFLRDVKHTGALCVDDIGAFLAWLGQSGWGTVAIEHQLLAIRQWASWLLQRQNGLDVACDQKAQLRQVGELTWDEGGGLLTSSTASPDWYTLIYTYRVDVAAPAIEALLRRGIPLTELAALRLGQLHFRYVDELVIQLNTRSWTLWGNQARLVRRCLEAGDRWDFYESVPNQPLFIETDWATPWPLACHWLGQARLEHRLVKHRDRHSPAWPSMNWQALFAKREDSVSQSD